MPLFNYNCKNCNYTNKSDGSGLFTLEGTEKSKQVFCPGCGNKAEFKGEISNVTSNLEMKEKKRQANVRASREAKQQAADYARQDSQEERVTINPPKGEKGSPIRVKKSTMDSIEKKTEDFIDKVL